VGRIPTPTPFAVGDINCYVLLPTEASDELILVDTGVRTDAAWEALRGGLKEFGFRVEDVSHLILTHAHPDHYGQARRIQQVSGCRIYIHEDARHSFERYQRLTPERMERVSYHYSRWGVPEELQLSRTAPEGVENLVEPIEPDRYLRDGDTLGFGDLEIDVIHTPGHCPEEVVYWIQEERTLLSGDHLLPDITPIALVDIPETPDTPRVPTLVQFLESLNKIEHLPAARAFPSHGDVIWDHRELIEDYRLHHAKRKLQIARQLRDGELSPGEIGAKMFRHVWRQQVHLVLSEVIGHLDLLEQEGNVEVVEREGVVRYRLVSLPPPV
jgi:glyoxylase-like metal-dependent hydrolase (beta-lactamase superfamily II)